VNRRILCFSFDQLRVNAISVYGSEQTADDGAEKLSRRT
jgi:hypothetical protein